MCVQNLRSNFGRRDGWAAARSVPILQPQSWSSPIVRFLEIGSDPLRHTYPRALRAVDEGAYIMAYTCGAESTRGICFWIIGIRTSKRHRRGGWVGTGGLYMGGEVLTIKKETAGNAWKPTVWSLPALVVYILPQCFQAACNRLGPAKPPEAIDPWVQCSNTRRPCPLERPKKYAVPVQMVHDTDNECPMTTWVLRIGYRSLRASSQHVQKRRLT